jgi:hypothetical protein
MRLDQARMTNNDDGWMSRALKLEAALKQALRQWHMYAEMVDDGVDLDIEKSPEGDMYRAAKALAENR